MPGMGLSGVMDSGNHTCYSINGTPKPMRNHTVDKKLASRVYDWIGLFKDVYYQVMAVDGAEIMI
jgi:hypothetical protein